MTREEFRHQWWPRFIQGSLWIVKERVWKRVNFQYDQNSDRKGHPGLVLGKDCLHYPGFQDHVYLAIGDSSPYSHGVNCIEVHKIWKNSNCQTTYFNLSHPKKTFPVTIAILCPTNESYIKRNEDKPNLDENEKQDLDRKLSAARLIFK